MLCGRGYDSIFTLVKSSPLLSFILFYLAGDFVKANASSQIRHRDVINIGIQSALSNLQKHPFLSPYISSQNENICYSSADGNDVHNVVHSLQGGGTGKKNLNSADPFTFFDRVNKLRKMYKDSNGQLPPVTAYDRDLLFWENMVCGATSRSVAQTIMHPANTMKTILQSRSTATGSKATFRELARPKNLKLLTRGAGAQFILSVPHGAVNFAVLEFVRRRMTILAQKSLQQSKGKFADDSDSKLGPGLDFLSSAISTVCCSIVSTPQMMVTDNIMAGTYPNLVGAISGITKKDGILGFYTGWFPGLAGKIPSYGLTWTFFQQLKRMQLVIYKRDPKDYENSIMGCIASATTVCILIPMDTIKTRLVTQANYPDLVPYKGIIDCAKRVKAEEGMIAFYRGLAPRLFSVVPMIGIQFGVYEFMKKVMLAASTAELSNDYRRKIMNSGISQNQDYESDFAGVAMEVAADDDQPFPAPKFHRIKSRPSKVNRSTR